MRGKYVAPTINETAFSCPHCGTLAPQRWLTLYGEISKEGPTVLDPNKVAEARKKDALQEEQQSEDFWAHYERIASGLPFARRDQSGTYAYWSVYNHHMAICSQCDAVSVWIKDQMIWPQQNAAPEPNEDLPDDILSDYREAGVIVAVSPRGAAALLRLCVQKLCTVLLGTESTKTIDQDIAKLVAKGLDKRIEQALDIVRVVGNEAVHPGTMDLRDDRATAEELFSLINIIAERMITQPRKLDELYAKLPADKVKGIEQRNARALPKPDEK